MKKISKQLSKTQKSIFINHIKTILFTRPSDQAESDRQAGDERPAWLNRKAAALGSFPLKGVYFLQLSLIVCNHLQCDYLICQVDHKSVAQILYKAFYRRD